MSNSTKLVHQILNHSFALFESPKVLWAIKGRHQWKKNVFFRVLPESPNPPPLDPNSGNLVLFSDVKIQDLKEGDILRHPGTNVGINMRNQYMFAHCASSQVTNCRSNCPSKKCILISGPSIPKSDLFSDAQPIMAGGSNWGKIWRWIFQRSNDTGSVPPPPWQRPNCAAQLLPDGV